MILRNFGFAFALVGSFLLGTLVPTATTQTSSQPRRYLQVQYMKVNPDKGVAYRSLEAELWKPVHQERVRRGQINSWAVYGVHLPGGEVDYDNVVLTEYPRFADLEDSKYPELFEEVQGMKDYDQILVRTNEARRRVRQDIWVLLEHTE